MSMQRLAREVVGLEERLLQVQSQQLKAGRDAESSREDSRRAATALGRAQAEVASLGSTLAMLQVGTAMQIDRTDLGRVWLGSGTALQTVAATSP